MSGRMRGAMARLRDADRAERAGRLRHLISLLRPYRGRVILMFISLVIATAAALAPPYLAGRAIDDGIQQQDMHALTVIVIAFVVAAVLNWVATYLQTYLINWVGQRALQDLRVELFEHLQKLSIGFYSRNRAGVLISRLTNDIQALDQLVTEGISTLFSATLTLVGTAVILVVLDPSLALITFLTFPVLLVASVAFRLASAGAYRLTREKIAQVTAYLQETLSGVRVVRAFGQEPRHRRRFAELNDEHREANMKTVYLNAAYFPSVELLSAVATAAILIYGGNQVARRRRHDRRARHLRLLPAELLRPDPVALAALHDLPGRDGGARQDLRAARRGAGRGGQARRRGAPARARGDPLRRRDLLLRRRRAGARPREPRRAARADARAGGRHRRRQVDARQARGPLLRPGRGPRADRRARPSRRHGALAALAARHRAAGELPVLRHDPRQHRASAAPTRPRRTCARRRRRWARTTSSSGCRTATTPRWASAAATCRPASASSWRSRARRPRTRAS